MSDFLDDVKPDEDFERNVQKILDDSNQKKWRKKQNEAGLHKSICQYLDLQYPHAFYNSDMAGEKFGKGQAMIVRQYRSGNGYPDLMICYKGKILFLELKSENNSPWLKKGGLKSDPHIAEQASWLIALCMVEGVDGKFAVGFDDAKEKIDEYFK